MLSQKQAGGDNSLNIQAERDVIINAGLSVSEVITLAEFVFKQNFPILVEAAREEAKKNVGIFFDELARQAAESLTDEERGRFATADMQYALVKASEQMARKADANKGAILANLLVQKSKEKGDLADSILTQAIELAAKLTAPQVELCCFVLLLNRVSVNLQKENDLRSFVHSIIRQFSGMALGNEAVGMLVALGCAAYQPGAHTFEGVLSSNKPEFLGAHYNEMDKWHANSNLAQAVRLWVPLNEDECAFIDKFNASDAHAIYITPIGRTVAYAYMYGKWIIKFDWLALVGDK